MTSGVITRQILSLAKGPAYGQLSDEGEESGDAEIGDYDHHAEEPHDCFGVDRPPSFFYGEHWRKLRRPRSILSNRYRSNGTIPGDTYG